MKHKGFTLVEAIVVLLILAVLAAILFPVFATRPGPDRRSSCNSQLKQIGLGFRQYIQDYDGEKFPPISNAGQGWVAAVYPYVRSEQIFQCPTDKSTAPATTDYYYNARLSEVKWEGIEQQTVTILAGEGTSNSPASYALSQLPDKWRADQSSPAWRHLGMANYLFADGHVRTLKAEKVTLQSPTKNQPTFLVK